MKLAIFHELVDVHTTGELREHFRFRHEAVYASFWLWHDNGTELSVVVNHDDAHAMFVDADGSTRHSTMDLMANPQVPRTYIGGEGPSLFISCCESLEAPDEMVEFLADNYEPLSVSRRNIVLSSLGLQVMEDFLCTGQRSEAILWEQLCSPLPAPKRKRWWQFWK